ncbi:iron complex transport system substrate-binding protein [Anaerotaenia torta]|uniref:helical backbone metal receptor n=1 Tax=Anaerotaenia torta TaxID=433293 RepID=UPI003D1ABFE4
MKKIIVVLLTLAMLLSLVACGRSDKERTGGQGKTVADTEDNGLEIDQSEEEAKADDAQEQGDSSMGEASSQGGSAGGEDSQKDWSQYRVVASSVAVVEILDALGVPMVGVPTSSYELPESVADAERIGNPMSPDMEVIASLEPTVVISVNTLSEDLKKQFETLEVESEFVDLSGYQGLKESITSLGAYFGEEGKAAELIAGFESREAAIADRIAGKEGPSVLIIFGAVNTFMAATENTYVGDLARRVGAENIMSGVNGGFLPIDMEFLADKNPEYILFMAHMNPEESLEAFRKEFETNEAWQNFDAVLKDKVIALDTGYFGMSANLLAAEAMDKLADYLYTE